MPGPQFEELKLQVSLEDNATAQIKSIKSALDELGTTSQASNIERLKRHTSEVDEALRKLIETVSKGPKGFEDLARNVTIAGLSLGTFALALNKTIEASNEVSKALMTLAHLSRATGQEAAQFKAIELQYERARLSKEQADREAQGFAEAADDMTRQSSRVRNALGEMFPASVAPRQYEIIQRMEREIQLAGPLIDKMTAARRGVDELQKSLDAEGGRKARRDIWKIFQAPGQEVIEENAKPMSDAASKYLDQQIEKARIYSDLMAGISETLTDIRTALVTPLMEHGLFAALKWADGVLTKWQHYVEGRKAETGETKTQAAPGTPIPGFGGSAGGGAAGGVAGAPGSPSGPAPIRERNQPWPAGLDWLFGKGYVPQKPSAGTEHYGSGTPQRFAGGGLSDALGGGTFKPDLGWIGQTSGGYSTNIEDRRNDVLEDQNDQHKLLINEIKRLNALLSGEEKPKYGFISPGGGVGGGIGGLPPMGYGGVPPSGDGGVPPSGDGRGTTPGGTRQDGRLAPPAMVTPSSQPGPEGRPMPPWGTTTAGFGGGAGLGAAGGVAGMPGTPSGPAPIRGGGGASGAPLVDPGGRGRVDQGALRARLEQLISQSGLAGKMPVDGARWGFKTGSAGEWAQFMTQLAKAESSLKPGDVGDVGHFGTGSRGLFQLSQADALTYHLQDTPFTLAQLRDPDFNARMAVKIMEQRVRQGGIMGPEGAQKYWAHGSTFSLLRGGTESVLGPGGAAPALTTTAPPPTGQVAGAGGISFGTKPFGPRKGQPGSGAMPPEALRNILEYAGRTAGVSTEIFAGIEGGHHRHLLDRMSGGIGSADVKLRDPTTGQILDSKIPADRVKMAAYITAAASAGGTGIGHADDYMSSLGIHVGGGPPAVWGAGGKGPNVPAWVREAYERGRAQALSPQQVATRLADLRKQQQTQLAGIPPTGGVTSAPAASQTIPPTDPAKALYEKLSQQETDVRALRRLREEREKLDLPETEFQMRGGEFGARARRRRGVFRTPLEEGGATPVDLDEARRALDRFNAPKKVEGTGDITVNVKHGPRTRRMNALKQVPIRNFAQGMKAEVGPPEPKAATGESHDAALDS